MVRTRKPELLALIVFRGMGGEASRVPLRATIISNSVNLALEPVCIFALELGLPGAALATVTGQVCDLTASSSLP